jgi:uncharacterized delta-60 repeat protein
MGARRVRWLKRSQFASIPGHNGRRKSFLLCLVTLLSLALAACAQQIASDSASCNAILCPSSSSPPASGSLDPSFGGSGTGSVVQSGVVGGLYDIGNAVVFDSQSRIIVAGSSLDTSVPAVQYAVVYRFMADGTLDTTFGTGGTQTQKNTAGGTYSDYGNGVAVDSSDRIVVSGESADFTIPEEWMTVWRFTTSGPLDTAAFGGGTGYLLTQNADSDGSDRDGGSGIALDSGGNILVTGFSRGSPAIEMALWRVLPTGTLDTAFNGAGSQTNYFGVSPGQNGGSLPLPLSNGDIVVTGYGNPNNNCTFTAIWHYDNTGAFQGASQSGNCGDGGSALLEDAGGNLVIVGSYNDGTTTSMAVWRYLVAATPTLDTTFAGGTGYTYQLGTLSGATAEQADSAVIDSLGRIVVCGYVTNPTATYAVIWRYLADGTRDMTFAGGAGYVAFTGTAGATTGQNDQARQIRLDSSGRYVVVGSSVDGGGNTRMVAWRVNP